MQRATQVLDSQEFLKFCQSHAVASDIDVAAGATEGELQLDLEEPEWNSVGYWMWLLITDGGYPNIEAMVCDYEKVFPPSVVATRCCKTCSHWLEEEFDSGECKQIRRGLDITVKAGWDGGYVEKVETEAYFECSFWEKR